MLTTRVPLSFVLMVTAAFFIGCGSRSPFPIEPVEGIISLDGKPVSGATVNFTPTLPEQGMPAFGRTDENGRYKLTALNGGLPQKGTMTGKYDVSVFLAIDPRDVEGADQEKLQDAPLIHVVPVVYNDTKTSGLIAEVVKGQNKIDFELFSKK